jgi:hypothetical protein
MKQIITIFLLLSMFSAANASPEWKLRKENDHMKIFTAASEQSAFKLVKVECTVKGTFSQVIAVLFDIQKHKEWVFNDKSSKLLKQVKSNELYYYSEVNVPWPCSNRDYIADIKVNQPSRDVVIIESHAIPDFIAEKEGIVRIKSSSAKWTMKSIGNNMLKIDYEIQFDPGGTVPAWLINMFVTKGPYETFERLQERMQRPVYHNVRFDFIKE